MGHANTEIENAIKFLENWNFFKDRDEGEIAVVKDYLQRIKISAIKDCTEAIQNI